uniref:Glycosyltransferase RgtA/B/C/D-like domain-containing protein n=1 Tax=Thermomicrobium roseum TaxID=500 RepID=A0A7C2BGY9_THERO
MRFPYRFTTILPVVLLPTSAAVVALVLNRVIFEGLPHTEDEVAFLFQATTLARGHLVAPAPPVPDAFAIPFVIVRDGMWFGKYPPGYPLVLALGVLVGYPPLVNAVAAALSVLLVTALAHKIYDFPTGLLAATLLVASPFFLIQAASFMAHTVCLALTLLFVFSFLLTLERPTVLRALPGALALALLVLARPLTALGVTLPFVFWALWRFWRVPNWRPASLCFAAGGLLGSAALLAYNQHTTGNPLTFGYELWWPFDRVGFGPGTGPGSGHTLESGLFNTRANLRLLEDVLFGWPGRLDLLPAALATAVALAQLVLYPLRSWTMPRSSSVAIAWDLALAAQVASLVALHIAYWTAGQMYGPRYYFEALGALVLLSARGILHLIRTIRWFWHLSTLRPEFPVLGNVVGTVALLGMITWGIFFTGFPWWQKYYGWYGILAEPARTIAAQAPANSVVLLPITAWTAYAPFFIRNSPLLDSPVLYARDLGPRNTEIAAAFPDRQIYILVGDQLLPFTASSPTSGRPP